MSSDHRAQIDEHFLKQKSWLKQSLFSSSLYPSLFFFPGCCCTAVLLAQLCCGLPDEASGDKSNWFGFAGYLKASSIPWSCPPYTEAQNCWGWQGPLEIVWSNLLAQARSARADCLGVHKFNTQLPAATENCSGTIGQESETRNKHGSNAVAHRVTGLQSTVIMLHGSMIGPQLKQRPFIRLLAITAAPQ